MKKIMLLMVAAVATVSINATAQAMGSSRCFFYSEAGVDQMMAIDLSETSCQVGNGFSIGDYNKSVLSNDGESVQILCIKKPVNYPTAYPTKLLITLKGNSGTISDDRKYFTGNQLRCK